MDEIRQVWTTAVGPPEVLKVRKATLRTAERGEVRIDVKAIGINFADIMARLGLYPDAPKLPAVLGYEVAGVVEGTDRRVVGICPFGGYSEGVVLREESVFDVPESWSFEEAVALPVNYLTAYQALHVMGGIRRDAWVLVHSVGGGVGFAAIDLCKHFGARVIGIASKPKHAALRERGVENLIDPLSQDFEREALRMTNGRGVDIILDPVGGESWAKGLRALAPTGRLVAYGFSGAATSKERSFSSAIKNLVSVPWLKINPISLMNQNKGVLGVNLGHLWNEREMVSSWMAKLVELAKEGTIKPKVDRSFSLEEAPLAHHYIQDRKNIGKVVLIP